MVSLDSPITVVRPHLIEFGLGTAGKLGAWAASKGYSRTLVISDAFNATRVELLQLKGEVSVFADVTPEPDIANLDKVLAAAEAAQADLIVGFGGGSAMDLAKLAAVLAGSPQTLREVVGPNKVQGPRKAALAQVPTTSGTGSEAGIRALVTDPETKAKLAVESLHMLADIAVIDPSLTFSVPARTTAATGVDAMAHCVEAFTNRKAHPMIDIYAIEGARLVGKYLARAVRDGADTEAREGLMLASYYGGICLGPVNTAAGHAIAYPLGTRLRLPHGLANAVIFPHVLAFNRHVAADKTAEVAEALGLGENLSTQALLDTACGFCRELGIEMSLAAHGATADDLPLYASDAHANRRLMDNNPIDMSVEDVLAIYKAAF